MDTLLEEGSPRLLVGLTKLSEVQDPNFEWHHQKCRGKIFSIPHGACTLEICQNEKNGTYINKSFKFSSATNFAFILVIDPCSFR
jgi:hypothetical protein